METWKPIKDYEGLYEISDCGRVKSLDRWDSLNRLKIGKILNCCDNGSGYMIVNLKAFGKQNIKTIHRLVAEAFIPNPNNLPCVNHKDGNKQNNNVDNLEWCTHSENMKHAFRTGLSFQKKGEFNSQHKLTQDDVDYIRTHYKKYDPEYGFAALGRKFGVSQTTVKMIVWNRMWTV